MAFGPRHDDSAGKAALQAQWPGGGPQEAGMKQSYGDWVRKGKERERLESDLAAIRGEIERLKADDEAMSKVDGEIKKAEQEIKKSDDELSQVEKKLADLNLKGLGEARDRKDLARKKVDDVVATLAAGADGRVAEKDFAKRLEWVKAFRKAKEEYDKEAASFAAEVKQRADALGGEGGAR